MNEYHFSDSLPAFIISVLLYSFVRYMMSLSCWVSGSSKIMIDMMKLIYGNYIIVVQSISDIHLYFSSIVMFMKYLNSSVYNDVSCIKVLQIGD